MLVFMLCFSFIPVFLKNLILLFASHLYYIADCLSRFVDCIKLHCVIFHKSQWKRQTMNHANKQTNNTLFMTWFCNGRHWGLNLGSFVCEPDAQPLSHHPHPRGRGYRKHTYEHNMVSTLCIQMNLICSLIRAISKHRLVMDQEKSGHRHHFPQFLF